MKLSKRALIMICALVLATTASAFGTIAYLTSTAHATNTFTVGNVEIKLDETDVDENGNVKYPVDTDGDGTADTIITVDDDGTITITDVDDPSAPPTVIEPTGTDDAGNPTYPSDVDVDGDGTADSITFDDEGNLVLNDGEDNESVIEPGRDDGNEYRVVPGETYLKDPMVTVVKGSEESYVRMVVELTDYAKVATALGCANNQLMTQLTNAPGTDWSLQGVTEDTTNGKLVFEYRYANTVDASDAAEDIELPPLFTEFKVPGTLDGEQLKSFENFAMVVHGHAIQAAGFADADAAWVAFGE
ncbi:MAG: hypothetical protein E7323_09955 [Clostridiales bacterium]|nr:hypothetical protein [Clostridiales bacterium]